MQHTFAVRATLGIARLYAMARCLSVRHVRVLSGKAKDFKGTPLFDVEYLRNGIR